MAVPLLILEVETEVEDELGNKFLDETCLFHQEPVNLHQNNHEGPFTQFQLQKWL